MMKQKVQISLILLYVLAVTLLFLPFLKQALLIYQTDNVTLKTSPLHISEESVALEAVQPPDLADVLAFKKTAVFKESGGITLPAVGISVPVFNGVTNQELLVGAGSLFPERSPQDHNFVLIGHHLGRENLLFGKLLQVKLGDSIYLRYENNFYHYKVKETKLVHQSELQVLDDHNQTEITLITCDKPTQTQWRYVVYGKLVQNNTQSQIKAQMVKQAKTITRKNQQQNRWYGIGVIVSFLLCLVLGIIIIKKISS